MFRRIAMTLRWQLHPSATIAESPKITTEISGQRRQSRCLTRSRIQPSLRAMKCLQAMLIVAAQDAEACSCLRESGDGFLAATRGPLKADAASVIHVSRNIRGCFSRCHLMNQHQPSKTLAVKMSLQVPRPPNLTIGSIDIQAIDIA
jgi:hypothetical protein